MTNAKMQDQRPRPYTIIENIILESHLTSLQKLTIIVLQKYAGKQSSAWPGVETLAKCTSSSSRQIRRVIKDLANSGLLKVEHRPGQSSIYHIPEYRLYQNSLQGVWKKTTPDTVSPPAPESPLHPGHHVRGDVTSCPAPPDTMSSKQYQEQYQGTSLSSREPPQPQKPMPPTQEREIFFDYDKELAAAWGQQFSIRHQPTSLKEQFAMDWMLHAARNNQLKQVNSPVAYLKTITRQGHPTDFIPFQEKKRQQEQEKAQAIAEQQRRDEKRQVEEEKKARALQKFATLSEREKTSFMDDFREHLKASGNRIVVERFDQDGINSTMMDALFSSFVVEKMSHPQAKNTPYRESPIKSPPTPHFAQC